MFKLDQLVPILVTFKEISLIQVYSLAYLSFISFYSGQIEQPFESFWTSQVLHVTYSWIQSAVPVILSILKNRKNELFL